MIHRIISHLVLFLVCTAQSADSDTTKESVFDNAMDMASTSNHQFATNSALFALDLYGILKRDRTDQNIIFSPISIQTCGALARIGAEGKTAEELDKGLRLISSDITAIAQSFHSLLNKYAKSDVLKIINRIYVMDGFQITNDFKSIANTSFFADAEEINFENNLSAAIRINEWVESKTKNLIKNLVSPNSLNNYTRMLLLNAVYFKGKWLNSFDQQSTRTENFYLNNQDAIQVSMMFTEGRFSFAYLSELNAAVIEMPYEDGDLSMLVILPDSRTGLENLENKLLTKSLSDITADMVSSKVRIKFPKFKAEFSVELKEAMEKLGMRRLFAEHAELGKMLKNSQMGVSEVVHKAYIVVNEEGTEAAAATGFSSRFLAPSFEEIPLAFEANRPFLYFIRDKREGIIFAGQKKK